MSGSEYKVYSARWWYLATLAILGIAGNAIFISYAAISTKVAAYYGVTPTKVDFLFVVGYMAGIVTSLMSTWLVAKLKLRKIMLIAAFVFFFGGAIRMVTTLPGINSELSKPLQYWLAFVAQLFIGIGQPLVLCLPPKLGHDWFPDTEGLIASGISTMATVLGSALSISLTPVIFTEASMVPYLNIMWFIPTAIGFIMTLILIRSDKPPTPPSKSAEEVDNMATIPFLKRMKCLLSNPNFLILVYCIGGIIGLFNAFISQTQQLLCSRGYPDWFSGLCAMLLLFCGIAGGTISSIVVQKTGWLVEMTKVSFGIGTIFSCIIVQISRFANQEVVMGILLAVTGTCAFGVLPLGFELGLEATYPMDAASGTSVIVVFSQLMSAILTAVSGAMEETISPEFAAIETCTKTGEDGAELEFSAKNHTNYLLLLSGVMTSQALLLIVCFRAKYKRREANAAKEKEQMSEKQKEAERKVKKIH